MQLNYLLSYLSNRYQCCKINNTLADWRKIMYLYPYNKNLENVICKTRAFNNVNWFYDNYMVLNPGKCHFTLFGVKENGQLDLMCNVITLKHSSHEKTIDNKLSFDEHIINIYKTANKKHNALSSINHYI